MTHPLDPAVFINPWEQPNPTSPLDMPSLAPYRRHSVAHQGMASSSTTRHSSNASQHHPSMDIFGGSSIWQKRSPSQGSLYPGSPSPCARSGQRRFSLAPMPMDDAVHPALSSVPEEPYFTYRRHSVAGPLFPTSTRKMSGGLLGKSLLTMNEEWSDMPIDMWCMVEFKAGRADIFHSTIPVNNDDWVIVEADRGRDLGKVVARDLPLHQVEWLLSSSPASSSPLDTPPFLDRPPSPSMSSSSSSSASSAASPTSMMAPATPSSATTPATTAAAAAPTKRICRLATPSEITLLVTKRQDEQKALLICQTKSRQKNMPMDIVDAEYQWDRRKLTFYFIADRRVDFRELVRDLFKIYKTRIWMCSVSATSKK